jgi:two-component system, OmpR family, response regulator RegX3
MMTDCANIKNPDRSIPRVLVLCNSPETGPAWVYCLQQKQIHAILETSTANILVRLEEQIPDLVIIDISRLTTNSFSSTKNLIKDLRSEIANPILLLSSRQEEEFILDMYAVGLDEYIIKPISPAMLMAKTLAWLRRSWTVPVALLDRLRVNKMTLLPDERVVAIEGRGSIKLTNLELRLLHVLMSCVGNPVSADDLIDRIWGYAGEADNTLLKNVIYRLRRKVETDPTEPRLIVTVPGIGYKFSAD